MRNIWGYISKSKSLIPEEHESGESEAKPMMIDFLQIRSLEERLSGLKGVDLFAYPNNKVVDTFSEVMETLHGLLSVVSQLKEEVHTNESKIGEYERLKKLASHHSEIVNNLQEQNSISLNKVYEDKREVTKELENKIFLLEQSIQIKCNQIEEIEALNKAKNEENEHLKKELLNKNHQIEVLTENMEKLTKKIEKLTYIEDSSIKFEAKGYNLGDVANLDTILIYSKIRKQIYSFLSPKNFKNLSLANKQINYICSKTLKKEFFNIVLHSKDNEIKEALKEMKFYEKIYDTFPPDNIKSNALKYLFFKIKPGAYMLSYFQTEQEDNDRNDDKEKKNSLVNFFKKKTEDHNKDRHLSFDALKNDNDFKETQKKVELFFDNLFNLEVASDLKNFNQIMKKQLNELKSELKSQDKSLQLLCMSKFMYLEINELYNLLQVCFSLLINKHNDCKELSKKNGDLKENDQVLRNLVDSIANDREEVEKRIFYLENQNLKNKSTEQILQNEIKNLKEWEESLKKENSEQKNRIERNEEIILDKEKEYNELKNKFNEIISVIEEIPNNVVNNL